MFKIKNKKIHNIEYKKKIVIENYDFFLQENNLLISGVQIIDMSKYGLIATNYSILNDEELSELKNNDNYELSENCMYYTIGLINNISLNSYQFNEILNTNILVFNKKENAILALDLLAEYFYCNFNYNKYLKLKGIENE